MDSKDRRTGSEAKTKISLIGVGPGSPDLLTREACQAIADAQILFGAKRMLKTAQELLGEEKYARMTVSTEYRKKEILEFLGAHPELRRAAVLYSGSLTFYSGAAAWNDFDNDRYETVRIPGISSVEYFLTKYGLSRKDVELLSAHGQDCRPEGLIEHRRYVLMILGKDEVFSRTCRNLLSVENAEITVNAEGEGNAGTAGNAGNTGGIRAVLAENLSYPDERITEGTLAQMADAEHGDLSMALFINPRPKEEIDGFAIDDDQFLRRKAGEIPAGAEASGTKSAQAQDAGGAERTPLRAADDMTAKSTQDSARVKRTVPMTREEIRCLSLSFMHLKKDCIFYDIGAGTGSVSIAAAEYLTGGRVYAFEKEPDACALMEENRRLFRAANMEIIPGKALENLENRKDSLPVPDGAFVGGSGGELQELVKFLTEWNPDIVMGISSVTLETARDLLQISEVLGDEWDVSMREVQTVRCKKAGASHLKLAGNPVTIAIIRKKNETK